MSPSPLSRASAACGLVLPLLLPGCGGAPGPLPPASLASVRVDGCVVDQFYVPNAGVPVRVLSVDGRTLAHATSRHNGEFTVRVPAGVSAAVAVDRAGGEWLPTPSLDRDRVVESCLVARD